MPVKGNLNSVLQRLELEVEFVVWLTRLVGESPVVRVTSFEQLSVAEFSGG